MSTYKTFFIQSHQLLEKKMDKYTSFRVDGLSLANEIQALLFEYEPKDYVLHSMETIQSTNSTYTYTEGIIVVLKKEIREI